MNTNLYFDVETNGLPLFKEPSDHPGQPHVTQLAAELVTDGGEVLASLNFLIKPNGWMIPEDLQALTGITMERAEKYGVPIDLALRAFIDLWLACGQRVAHNESFDARMIRIELMRNEFFAMHTVNDVLFADHWKAGQAFCTMANSTSIIKLPPTEKMKATGRNGHKSPNLGEAYKFFTGQELQGAHNAMIDVGACRAVHMGILAHKSAEAS